MVASGLGGATVDEATGPGPDSRDVLAVIFDLDGVLVDSESWWAESRAAVARRHGVEWTAADEASVKGANTPEWAAAMRERLALPTADEEIAREVVAAMIGRYTREGPTRIGPGLAAVGRLRARYPLAVASSAHPDVIEAALRSLGIAGAFRAVVSADEVGAGKPAPDVYLEAARRLDVPPARCFVIEDSPSGVRAARSAGMRVIWVGVAALEGAPPAEDGSDPGSIWRLATLDDLDESMLGPGADREGTAGAAHA